MSGGLVPNSRALPWLDAASGQERGFHTSRDVEATQVAGVDRDLAIDVVKVRVKMPTGPAGPPGEPGPQGPAGAPGSHLFIEPGPPQDTMVGVNEGDVYLDSVSGGLYQFTLGRWRAKGFFAAPEGPAGPAGPAGPVGPVGATPALRVGQVTTGAAGSSASVTISGAPEFPVLGFVIPRGDAGAQGATPVLVSGEAESLPPGSQATVDVVPLGGNTYRLDLGVPQGPQGPAGAAVYVRGELGSAQDLPVQGFPGDGWLITGSLWVWSDQGWIDAGPVQGPVGPQGPAGESAQVVEFALAPVAAGDGSFYQDVVHALVNRYPSVRVLGRKREGSLLPEGQVGNIPIADVVYRSASSVRVIFGSDISLYDGLVVLT